LGLEIDRLLPIVSDADGNEELSGRSLGERLRRRVIGPPRDVKDPGVFDKIALLPFFAWIGLGADGLSSSAYGPEEAFRALGSHIYLSIFIGLVTALTVFIISYTYTKIIERFPHGGGGYLVATKMLGKKVGLVSGSALIVDYILTITVSIVSSTDAIFSYLPPSWRAYKIAVAAMLILLLVIINIRGIKESISFLAPIFLVFLATHIVMLSFGFIRGFGKVSSLAVGIGGDFKSDIATIGFAGLAMIFLRAYSLGGGTYTGIEAVSNGMQIMREPRIKNGKRTMAYLGGSLAIMALGLFVCYLFAGVRIEPGRTLNSTLADTLYGGWGAPGRALALVTILSEGALLLVGAQAGFIDAPRVMANMAVDSWLPHRFADYSERLTMRNGIVMIGVAALLLLFYTKGSVSALIVMYSINVFLTFSISEFAMVRHFVIHRKDEGIPIHSIFIQMIGFVLCCLILVLTIYEKFTEGGWLTLLITGCLIGLCVTVRRHYARVGHALKKLDNLAAAVEVGKKRGRAKRIDPDSMTAIQLVSGYNGMGIHTFLSICSSFHGLYKNFIFVSIGVVNQAVIREGESVTDLMKEVDASLAKYTELARFYGYAAESYNGIGTNVVDEATELCRALSFDYKKSTVFSGNLVFEKDRPIYRLLHNETAFAIQRRLQWDGITNVVLPIKIR
jgi:amino acid transporter